MICIQSMCCTELMSCIKARRQHGRPVMHAMHGMHQIPWPAASLATLDNIFMLKKPQECGQFCQAVILFASCKNLQTANRVCGQASRINSWTNIHNVQIVGNAQWVVHPEHTCRMWAVLVCFQNIHHLNTDPEGEEIGQAAWTTKRFAMKNVHAMHRTPEIQEMQDIQLIHESIRFMRCIQSMCCTELMLCIKARRQHGLPVMHAMHDMHQITWHAASLASLDKIFRL